MRVAILVLATGCLAAPITVTPEMRTDIVARMTSAQNAITACYAQALDPKHPVEGTMVLAFATQPGTGQFTSIRVTQDQLGDPRVERCVVQEVGKLRLAQPPGIRLAINYYPVHFTIAK
jgi:hypothetical protein